MSALPPDWQRQMVSMIVGTEPAHEGLFAGGPVLGPMRQIGIYQEQYRLRLTDAVLEDLQGLRALMGDDALRAYVQRYIVDHPSSTWTLNRVAMRFPDWFAEQGGSSVQVELARLDLAVTAAFEAAPGRSIDVEALANMPPLELQPHVRLMRLHHNLHAYRSAVLGGSTPPDLREQDVPCVIFRRGIRMRHKVIDSVAFDLLLHIQQRTPVPQALEAVVAAGASPAHLGEHLGGWFREFAQADWVQIYAS